MSQGPTGYEQIPRIVWMLWFDGWDCATELHHRCLESWQLFNPDWEVRSICRADLPKLLGQFQSSYQKMTLAMNALEKFGGFWIPPAAESDLLRLLLLTLHGGVWADSTMLCRRPLDEWLPTAAASGFFAFAPEKPADNLPVMSSFLASSSSHPVLCSWLKAVVQHWSTPSQSRKDLGFFWVHQLFGQVVSEGTHYFSAEAQAAWAAVPARTGEYGVVGPHYFVPYNDKLRPPPTEEFQQAIHNDRETPMWKLTNHEVKLADVGPESCYRVLLEETRKQAQEHLVRKTGLHLGPAFALLSVAPPEHVLKRLVAQGCDICWCPPVSPEEIPSSTP